MDDLEIQSAASPSGTRILILKGALTLRTLFEFQGLARQDHSHSLIIDLDGVPYMDSAGLGAIIGAFTSCQRSGQGFGLVRMPARIATLFQVAGVDKLIPQYESIEAAERQFPAKA
jgi:anti-sigma B factor antagonist